jgi:TRAP-type C4-dicarboxylate transport system permease small subunit
MVVLAFAIFLSLASVQGRDQHIKVSMLLGRFPWLKNWSDGITLIVGFSLLLLMTWYSLPFALRSFAVKESSPIIPVPIYLGKFAFFVGCAMFCIQFFIQLLSRLFTRPVSGVPSGKEEG